MTLTLRSTTIEITDADQIRRAFYKDKRIRLTAFREQVLLAIFDKEFDLEEKLYYANAEPSNL